MNETLIFLCVLFLAHFIGDFLLQSREMGRKKSKEYKWLLGHCGIIFGTSFVGLFLLLLYPASHISVWGVIIVASMLSLFISSLHMVIDASTWNIYSWFRRKEDIKTFKFWEDHWFFVTIGADQLLHILTILVATNLFMT